MRSKSSASGVLRAAPGTALAHVYLHGSLGDADYTYSAVQFDNTDRQPQITVRPLPVTHPYSGHPQVYFPALQICLCFVKFYTDISIQCVPL